MLAHELGHTLFPPHSRKNEISLSLDLERSHERSLGKPRRLTPSRLPLGPSILLSKSKPDRMIGSSSSGSGDVRRHQIEARSPITPPIREPACLRSLVPSTTPLPRHRFLGSISGAGSHPRVEVAVFPVGLRASWFEATPRGARFTCRFRAHQHVFTRDSLEASNSCVSDKIARA